MNRLAVVWILLLPALLLAQSTMIRDESSTRLAAVDVNKNVRVSIGASDKETFNIFSVGDITSLPSLVVTAPNNRGFRVRGWCVSFSSATAAGVAAGRLRRVTNQSFGASDDTKVAPFGVTEGTWPGGVALNTSVTQGALIGELMMQNGEIGVGAADYPSGVPVCVSYSSEAMPHAPGGKDNGFQLQVLETASAGALMAATLNMSVILDEASK